MSSSYPNSIDVLTNPTASDALDSVTVPHAGQHTNANDAIEAIESTLGVNPQGSSVTVVARLNAVDSSVGNLAVAKANSGANSDITSLSALSTPLSVAQGGTGVASHTSGSVLVGNGSGSLTSTPVTIVGAVNSIVKTGATGGISAGAGGVSSSGQMVSGNIGVTVGSIKFWGSFPASSATITPPVLTSSTAADQVLPIVGGTLVSTGMVSSNAQVSDSMLVSGVSSSGASNKLVKTDASGNITASGNIALGSASSGGALNLTATSGNVQTIQAQTGTSSTLTLRNSSGTVAYQSDTIAVGNGGTGATATTGSGNNVLDTSPTITTPTITTPTITNLKTANEIYKFQSAPQTITTAITAANLLSGLVTSGPTAPQSSQLPTGSSLQLSWAISSSPAGYAVEWSYINTGSANATVTTSAGSTNTMVAGNNAVVAAGTSGRFLTKNTAINTFLTYRLA